MPASHLVAFSLLGVMILRKAVGFLGLGSGVGVDVVTHCLSLSVVGSWVTEKSGRLNWWRWLNESPQSTAPCWPGAGSASWHTLSNGGMTAWVSVQGGDAAGPKAESLQDSREAASYSCRPPIPSLKSRKYVNNIHSLNLVELKLM